MSTAVLPPAPREDRSPAWSPYRGLVPYTEADAAYFFGRTDDRRLIAANLEAYRLTLLFAPSGVGKSSVLSAGVARHLRDAARARVAAGREPALVPVVARRWSVDPLAEIREAARVGIEAVLGSGAEPGATELTGLAGALDAWSSPSGCKLLIILDQFEEFLLYHGLDWDSPRDPAPQLAAAIRAEDLRANFLVAIREDAVAKMDRFKGRIANPYGATVRLARLGRGDGREAVVKPLARWNDDHPAEPPVEIEPELVDAILDQVETGAVGLGRERRPASGRPATIEAPYLQLVLTRIWEHERAVDSYTLRLATLEELGGAKEIVRSHLDRELNRLPEAEKDVAAAIFDRMVTPTGAKVALSVGDLSGWTGYPGDDLQRVLDDLARSERQIVRAIDPMDPDAPRSYEISHDSLADGVLDWRARHRAQRQAAELVAADKEAAKRRLLRRVRLTMLLVGAVVLLVIAALAIVAWHQRSEANRQANIANARRLAAAARVELGADPELAVVLAREAVRRRPRDAEPIGALRAALASNAARGVLRGGSLPVRAVQSTTTGNRVFAWGDDGHLRVWRVADRRVLLDIRPAAARLTGAQLSPDGRRIVSASADGVVAIWGAWSGRRLETLRRGGGPASRPRWDSTGQLVLAVTDGGVSVWDTGSRRRLARLATGPLAGAEWQPRSDARLVTAGADGVMRLWDARRGRVIRSHAAGRALRDLVLGSRGTAVVALGAEDPVAEVWNLSTGQAVALRAGKDGSSPMRAATFDHSGTRVATASIDRRVRIWNAHTGALRNVLTGNGAFVTAIAFSSDDSTIATGGNDRTARLWNADTGDQLAVLRGHRAWISTVAFLPSRGVVTGAADGDVRLWTTGDAPAVVLTPRAEADVVSFSPDGTQVVIATVKGVELRPWRAGTGRSGRFIAVKDGINNASLRRDGKLVVVGTAWDGSPGSPARVLRVEDGRQVGRPLTGPVPDDGAVTAVFSPDGRLILTTHRDGAARLWVAQSHRLLRRLGPATAPSADTTLVDGRFSPDGRRVATVGAPGVVRVFDVRSGRVVRTFRPSTAVDQALNSVVFQPHGHVLATVGVNANARLWDLQSRDVRDLPSDDDAVGVAFNPSGELLATGSFDGTVRLWDVRTGQALAVLEHISSRVVSVAFSPDGRRLVASDLTPRVNVLACEVCRPTGELLHVADAQVPRGLTPREHAIYLGGSDG